MLLVEAEVVLLTLLHSRPSASPSPEWPEFLWGGQAGGQAGGGGGAPMFAIFTFALFLQISKPFDKLRHNHV